MIVNHLQQVPLSESIDYNVVRFFTVCSEALFCLCKVYFSTNISLLSLSFYLCVCLCLCVCVFSWDIEGAVYGTQCGEIESGMALVFERGGERKMCTPYLDTTSFGNIRFHFTMGKVTTNTDCYPRV